MVAIYGHRWTSAYGERCDDDAGALTLAGDTWQRGLTGVSEQAIAAGLQGCLMSADPWPPTLPAFRALCLQVPSLAAVRLRLRNGKPDAFARMVWQQLDTYAWRQADAVLADRMLRDAYDLTREHVMTGGELPAEPTGAIEQEKREHKPAPPEVAEKHIADIAAVLQDAPDALADASDAA
jgi:hypothetical protein